MTVVRRGLAIALLGLVALATGSARAERPTPQGELVEVVIGLSQKPLGTTRWLAGRDRQTHGRWSQRRRPSRGEVEFAIPGSQVRWRYQLVANGMAVVVPRSELGRLSSLPGVDRIYRASATARSSTTLRGRSARRRSGAGARDRRPGDEDRDHRRGDRRDATFFSPAGYTMPAGYPKGQTAYTTAKVIVARAFPPRSRRRGSTPRSRSTPRLVARHARRRDRRRQRQHTRRRRPHLGRRAARVPRQLQGADDPDRRGRRPRRQLAGARRRDRGRGRGRHGRDQHVARRARDRAVARHRRRARSQRRPSAGVVSVVAAGNDYADFGRGSVGSPGASPLPRSPSAPSRRAARGRHVVASFSSSGPTPLSLQLKPEVSAPGVGILSSIPAAAIRRHRARAWPPRTSPAPPRCSCSGTRPGRPRRSSRRSRSPANPRSPTNARARRADDRPRRRRRREPRPRRQPARVCVAGRAVVRPRRPSTTVTRQVELTDAGGGGGPWTVTLAQQRAWPRRPFRSRDRDRAGKAAGDRDDPTRHDRGAQGLHRAHARLGQAADPVLVPHRSAEAFANTRTTPLGRPGVYSSTTKGGSSRVTRYFYPERPAGFGFAAELPGPERVFRVRLAGPALNFGVVITSHASGVSVEPRIVLAGDERRLNWICRAAVQPQSLPAGLR